MQLASIYTSKCFSLYLSNQLATMLKKSTHFLHDSLYYVYTIYSTPSIPSPKNQVSSSSMKSSIYLPWRFLSYSSHLKSYILHSMAFLICSASSSAEVACLCLSSRLIFSTSSSISSSTPPFLPSS